MKKLILSLICAISLVGTSFAQSAATTTIEKFRGARITGLEMAAGARVSITQGNDTYFKITIPKELESRLSIKLDDSQVEVKWTGMGPIDKSEQIVVEMVCNTLEDLSYAGGGVITINGAMVTPELDIELSGSAQLNASNLVVSNELDISAAGSCALNLTGSAAKGELSFAGSCKAEMSKFEVASMDVELAGSGDVKVWAKSYLEVSIAGSGKVGYKGSPKVMDEIAGSGKLYTL